MIRLTICLWITLFAPACGADQQRIASIIGAIDTPYDEPIPFVERRNNELLTEPLVLYGHMLFTRDGLLSKRVERPSRERVTISSTEIEFEYRDKLRRFALEKRPDLHAFYIAMMNFINGDAERLADSFAIETQEEEEGWRIILEPKLDTLREFIFRMTISGRNEKVLLVRTEQPGGDWQEMSFDEPGT